MKSRDVLFAKDKRVEFSIKATQSPWTVKVYQNTGGFIEGVLSLPQLTFELWFDNKLKAVQKFPALDDVLLLDEDESKRVLIKLCEHAIARALGFFDEEDLSHYEAVDLYMTIVSQVNEKGICIK